MTTATPAAAVPQLRIPLAAIAVSKTNPRKHFDQVALDELAESIRKHDVVQAILVRPNGGPGKFELVAGERRFRAAKAAGLVDIPATVRELSDTDALEIQVVENLQRKNLDEMEEAEGYDQLLKCARTAGKIYTADEIAKKVGKSRSYVFSRLKLCALCPEARKSLQADEIDASKALLIARIGHHDTQRKALKDVLKGEYGDGEPMSYREAHKHILQVYMLKLSSAPFDTKDAQLLVKAGDCIKCPKRTGNEADLFGDVKSADVCTDPKCFDDKRQAHYGKAVKELEAKGKKVIYGDEAKKAFPDWEDAHDNDRLSDRYAPMSGYVWIENRHLEVRAALGEAYQPLLIQHPATGKVMEVATKQAVEAAAKRTGKSASSKAKAAKVKGPKAPDVDEVLTERLAKMIHDKAPKEFGKAWILALAGQVLAHMSMRDLDAVALAWGWKSSAFKSNYSKKLPAEASKLGERDLVLLMFHMVFAIGAYSRDPVLKLFGIDEKGTREKVIEDRKAAARKAREEAKASKPAKKVTPQAAGPALDKLKKKIAPAKKTAAKKKAAKK